MRPGAYMALVVKKEKRVYVTKCRCCWWLFERKPKLKYKRNILGIPKMTNILEFAQVRSAFSPDFGGKYRIFLLIKIKIAERGFDPRTSGLWAQHASTAPLCYRRSRAVLPSFLKRSCHCLCKAIVDRKCQDSFNSFAPRFKKIVRWVSVKKEIPFFICTRFQSVNSFTLTSILSWFHFASAALLFQFQKREGKLFRLVNQHGKSK